MKKRFITLVLAAAMVLCMLSGMTFATNGSWIGEPVVPCWPCFPPIDCNYPCQPPCNGEHYWPPYIYDTCAVTASADWGGYITPSGTTFVKPGTVMTYYIIPASGHEIAAVYVNGVNWGNSPAISIHITGNTTISAFFTNNDSFTNGGSFITNGSFITGDYNKTPAKESFYDTAMEMAGMSQPFYADVKTTSWYYADLTWLWIRGLTDAGTNFYPDALTTRGCIVEWIWRMEGRPVTRNHSFTDTTAMSAIWGGANHVVYGYSEDTFGPNDYINREQLAAIIYRYGLYNDVNLNDRGDLSAFSDAAEVSDWAAEAMSWAVGTGIVEGRTDGTLDPKGTATRAEAAAMLHRASLYFGL